MQLVKSLDSESKTDDYVVLLEKTNSVLSKIKKNVGFYDYKHNMIK